jgi:succinate dehydrogenase hydrophobic anchor subunit
MLWLALIHGANGMRTLVNDYASSVKMRTVLAHVLVPLNCCLAHSWHADDLRF